MNHILIKTEQEITTTQGIKILPDTELRIKKVISESANNTFLVYLEHYENSNNSAIPVLSNFTKVELDNELLLTSLIPLIQNSYSQENIETSDLIIKNTIWHDSDNTRNIRVYMTFEQACFLCENYTDLFLAVKTNNVPRYHVLNGRWLYFQVLDEDGTNNIENLLKSIGCEVQKRVM